MSRELVAVWKSLQCGSHLLALGGCRIPPLLSLSLLWLLPAICAAQPINIDSFVTRSFRGADVLRVDTEFEMPATNSFSVARVTITNPKRNSLSDRNFVVVFYTTNWGSSAGFSYTATVELQEGSRQATVSIPHVQMGTQTAWDVALFENGRELEDKQGIGRNGIAFQWANQLQETMAFAAMQGATETSSVVTDNLNSILDPKQVLAAGIVNTRAGSSTTQLSGRVVPVSELDGDWRVYFSYTGWILSAAALKEINATRSNIAEAIRHYVAAGGTLVVHSAAESSDMIEVDRLLTADEGKPASRVWVSEKAKEILRCKYLGGNVLLSSLPLTSISNDLLAESMRSVNANNVIASASPSMDGNWFWRNLIKAVGKPPVWTFCAMITIFGALLGPGLLYFTGRIGRRSLMIFLVPVISFSATTGIILYGVLYEGFDTYVRITSLSRIDVPAKVGFAWSRQNYFSGLPPREGLAFRPDTYVRPVQPEDDESNYYRASGPRQNLDGSIILADKQIWRGWLKPRQQQQLLIAHPISQPETPFEFQASARGGLKIRNVSGQDLPFVIARGGADNYYFCEDLPSGATMDLVAEMKVDVGSHVAQVMVDYRPTTPDELADGGSLLQLRSRRRLRSMKSNESLDVLNIAMKDYLSDRLNMQPYSFATILGGNDAIEVPLQGKQSDGLHLVIGVQPW